METADNSVLHFYFPGLSESVSTDLGDIEILSNNLVVAPAIGNLVAYFSDERPVPYLAKTWRQDGNRWIFELREGLKCDNGEPINAENFIVSLARSIRLFSQGSDHPVFSRLTGFKEFMTSRNQAVLGLKAVGNSIIFEFVEPVKSGFLEHLTMAPFGYICSGNFKGDSWKDPSQIISSGPFRLITTDTPNDFTLVRRDDWIPEFQSEFEKVVIRRDGISAFRKQTGSKLIELREPADDDLLSYGFVRQVPQGLTIVKANTNNGVFKSLAHRRLFFSKFRENLNAFKYESKSIHKTERFFSNDISVLKEYKVDDSIRNLGSAHLKMKVMLRSEGTPNYINRNIAELTAKQLGWSIEFDSNTYSSFKDEYESPRFDLYVQSAEIGGGFEPWVIDMLFCSDVGNRWPDPSGRICELSNAVERGSSPISTASQNFQDILIDDAAVLPTFHIGGYYLLSKDLDMNSLGPIVTRVRFEEIRRKR